MRAWQVIPVFLPGESYEQRSLAGYSPWGREESDTTEATSHSRESTPVGSILGLSVGRERTFHRQSPCLLLLQGTASDKPQDAGPCLFEYLDFLTRRLRYRISQRVPLAAHLR